MKRPWTPADLDRDWPMVKHIKDVLTRPSVSKLATHSVTTTNLSSSLSDRPQLGLPILHRDAPETGADRIIVKLPETIVKGLVKACRKHQCGVLSAQVASVIITAMQMCPPTDDRELRVTYPFNPVNIAPRLATRGFNGALEIVTALSFNTIITGHLERFKGISGEKEVKDAIWKVAGEIDAQIRELDKYHDNVARMAPSIPQTMAEAIFSTPP